MATSFPYLAISRQTDIPYAEVLALADFIEKHGAFDPIFHDLHLYCMVENAVMNEQYRRRKVWRSLSDSN